MRADEEHPRRQGIDAEGRAELTPPTTTLETLELATNNWMQSHVTDTLVLVH